MKTALSVLILALAVAAGLPPQQDDLKKLFPDVEGVKRSARKVSKESREKIEKALERKLEDKELSLPIWEGRALVSEAHTSDKVRLLYTVVSGRGAKGDFKIGVAVAPEERVLAGTLLLENKDDPALADFLSPQFDQWRYTPNVLGSHADLAELRKTAAQRKDGTAKQMDAIFKLHEIMHPVETTWHRLNARLDADSKDAAADAEAIAKLFSETEKLIPDFTFLRPAQMDTFRRRLKDGTKELGALTQHAKAGKMAEARNAASEIAKMSCSQCHAGTERLFREKRLEFGMGNGYFSLGLDVSAPDGPKETFTAAAAAIRLAVLILSEAR